MKKNLQMVGVILSIIIILAIWICYDLSQDPNPLYIPGRDTIKQWNDGVCEIVGTSDMNELSFLKQTISSYDNFVKAYRKVDHQIFFIMTRGKIVVDLETKTYEIYEEAESVNREYKTIFDDQNSFVWLSENE